MALSIHLKETIATDMETMSMIRHRNPAPPAAVPQGVTPALLLGWTPFIITWIILMSKSPAKKN